MLPQHNAYEGNGVSEGDFLPNFQLKDQHGQDTCLNQFLGSVLIVDASTRWCGPCNEAAAESERRLLSAEHCSLGRWSSPAREAPGSASCPSEASVRPC